MNRETCLSKLTHAKRVVIKVGTLLLTESSDNDGIKIAMVEKLCNEILFLRKRGCEVILITSGAVGLGRMVMKSRSGQNISDETQATISRKQALSAIGQSRLMKIYDDVFSKVNVVVAQILITARDFRDRRSYLNIGHTISELISMGILPIVNENDTVATDELRELRFGDNDMLSGAVASLFGADVLIILTSVDGFLKEGKRVPFLSSITQEELNEAKGPFGPGTGGMHTKIRVAQLASLTKTVMAILPGAHVSPIQSMYAGEDIGTLICGREHLPVPAKKRWLLYARTDGALGVDDGAKNALIEKGSSLLPAGVVKVKGSFLAGDIIEVLDKDGISLGRGIVNYGAKEIQSMLGLRIDEIRKKGMAIHAEEIMHRNNLMIELSSHYRNDDEEDAPIDL